MVRDMTQAFQKEVGLVLIAPSMTSMPSRTGKGDLLLAARAA